MPLTLRDIASLLSGATIIGDPDVTFDDIQYDSRQVTTGTLFAAFPGGYVDGHASSRTRSSVARTRFWPNARQIYR